MEKQRMTRQEALKELENLTIDYSMRTAEEIERLDEAVDMAIAALREDAVDRPTCDDAVSRAAAINAVKKNTFRLTFAEEQGCEGHVVWSAEAVYSDVIEGALLELPSAQSHDIARDIATIIENEKDMRVILKNAQPDTPDTNGGDIIYRQAAIDALESIGSLDTEADKKYARSVFEALPSVQSERTCVNCGRTINNGGWYADGRTRCPIEEHYALPKDGYCHLWEKRNVTDDDYPERQEVDGERKTDE